MLVERTRFPFLLICVGTPIKMESVAGFPQLSLVSATALRRKPQVGVEVEHSQRDENERSQ